MLACLRYFKNDRGQTIAERGVEKFKGGAKTRQGLRFFALYGVISLIFVFFYIVPSNVIAINGGSWPDDTLQRSYFTDFICGDGTAYAWPGAGIPIARTGSSHVDPQGNLVPGSVRQKAGVGSAP
jgi:hypothetical protein